MDALEIFFIIIIIIFTSRLRRQHTTTLEPEPGQRLLQDGPLQNREKPTIPDALRNLYTLSHLKVY